AFLASPPPLRIASSTRSRVRGSGKVGGRLGIRAPLAPLRTAGILPATAFHSSAAGAEASVACRLEAGGPKRRRPDSSCRFLRSFLSGRFFGGGLCSGSLRRGFLLGRRFLRRRFLFLLAAAGFDAGGEERERFVERHLLGLFVLRRVGVGFAVIDVGAVAAVEHADRFAGDRAFAELLDRRGRGAAEAAFAAAGRLLVEQRHGAVHLAFEHVLHAWHA